MCDSSTEEEAEVPSSGLIKAKAMNEVDAARDRATPTSVRYDDWGKRMQLRNSGGIRFESRSHLGVLTVWVAHYDGSVAIWVASDLSSESIESAQHVQYFSFLFFFLFSKKALAGRILQRGYY